MFDENTIDHVESGAASFLNDFLKETSPIEGEDLRLWEGVAQLEIQQTTYGFELVTLRAINPFQGDGVKALEFVKGLAKRHADIVYAETYPIDDTGIQEPQKLRDWYINHGGTPEGNGVIFNYTK